MRILPVAAANYAQKNQQSNFKSKFVKSDTLEKAFISAEKQACENFMDAVTNLKNDRLNRTIELSGGIFCSKDGALYTKTKLLADGKVTEMVGFPNLYGITPDESIGNDARLLLIDFANSYRYNKMPKNSDEVIKGIQELKKQILK